MIEYANIYRDDHMLECPVCEEAILRHDNTITKKNYIYSEALITVFHEDCYNSQFTVVGGADVE